MSLDVRRVDHRCVDRSSVPGKLPEQIFPHAAPRPADKAVLDRGRTAILGWAIAPAATALARLRLVAAESGPSIGSPQVLHGPRRLARVRSVCIHKGFRLGAGLNHNCDLIGGAQRREGGGLCHNPFAHSEEVVQPLLRGHCPKSKPRERTQRSRRLTALQGEVAGADRLAC